VNQTISTWNLTISNTTISAYQTIQEWNLTISDSSAFSQISEWNLTISDSSADSTIEEWNLTISNVTAFTTISTWNLTIKNTTLQWITISNIYPGNNSNNIGLQPYLYAQFNSTVGNNLNISWYYNSSTLGTEINITNGTYNELMFEADDRASSYTWRVHINDGEENWLNRSYSFQTEGYANNMGYVAPSNVLAYLGIFGILAFAIVLIILFKRREGE